MKHWIGAATLALTLAACGGGGETNEAAGGTNGGGNTSASANAGGSGTAAAGGGGGGGATMQPGQWEVTTAVTGLEGAGMPAGMQNALPPPTTTRVCLTAEQVAQPAIATGGVTNQAGCRTETNNVAGGRLNSNVLCEAPGGGRVRVATTGQMSGTSFEFESRTEVTGQGTNMTTRSRVTGRRVGDCPA